MREHTGHAGNSEQANSSNGSAPWRRARRASPSPISAWSTGLFAALDRLGHGDAEALADRRRTWIRGYVRRWCDAAYAFGYLEAEGEVFRLGETGAAMRPDAPDTLMPMAVQAVLNTHMAERAAGLMRSGERPGEQVMAERETVLPWFGPMLEANFAAFLRARRSAPACRSSPRWTRAAGWSVDLGCGNGWYLRALARRCGAAARPRPGRVRREHRPGDPARGGRGARRAAALRQRRRARLHARPSRPT